MLIDQTHNVHEQILDTLRCWGARLTRGSFACRIGDDGELVPVIVVEGKVHDLVRRDITGANQLFQLGCAEHVPVPIEEDDKLRDQLREIDEADWIDVTEWEATFIQSILYARDRPTVLTPAQRAKIRQIYNQYQDRL